jgi:hypothetical protein
MAAQDQRHDCSCCKGQHVLLITTRGLWLGCRECSKCGVSVCMFCTFGNQDAWLCAGCIDKSYSKCGKPTDLELLRTRQLYSYCCVKRFLGQDVLAQPFAFVPMKEYELMQKCTGLVESLADVSALVRLADRGESSDDFVARCVEFAQPILRLTSEFQSDLESIKRAQSTQNSDSLKKSRGNSEPAFTSPVLPLVLQKKKT